MVHDGRAIANFVLDRAEQSGWPVTNLKLQKVVYFCHVWSLIELGRPLIKHSFEAWEHGPVLPYLYRDFKDAGAGPIKARALALDPSTGRRQPAACVFDLRTLEVLDRVVNFYGRLSASGLVELSHVEGGPWHKVWHHQSSVEPGMRIDDREIVRFYSRIHTPFAVQ